MACIGEQLKQMAEYAPDRIAIETNDGKISYRDLYQSIRSLQRNLAYKLPNKKGKRIGFLLPNSPRWLELFIAISSSGGIAIPFDPKWSMSQLQDVINDAEPDLIIYDSTFSGLFENMKAISITDLGASAPSERKEEHAADQDPFYIGYTSGTTGRPKGFIRSHASWADCFSVGQEVFSLDVADRILCPGPLVHSHFLYAAVQSLHIGATLYLTETFEEKEVWGLLQKSDITVLYIVPTMFEALNRVRKGEAAPKLQALISSGAKWEKQSKQQAVQVFPNATVYEFYGASELSFVSYRNVEEKLPEGAIGTPFPGVEIAIFSNEGKRVKQGEVGNLYVKSPWTFDGYLNLPEETEKVFDGDWATVGDLAFENEEGHVILVGRKQNMIISGGLNIYPEEVEQVIRKHPAIEEVVVKGIADDYWGEKAVAFVTAVQKEPLVIEEIKGHLADFLPKYKCPKEWFELEAFPYTSSGKIARKELQIPVRSE
ncbi:long-chain acyl-CoA synthetase [Thalassobacillus cyri]|uniref:Long-chain acyl-CoA synthetase n=1 Tax=Thalassobacillus cyri TaxID=571932 RepID=A0A1H4E5S6_9BACI|nr:AMP-binding protein [Thalassobacillus cyri]SEA80187.1 long-chain acyl-CoA synthetase [Thalassobacillus cyri]